MTYSDPVFGVFSVVGLIVAMSGLGVLMLAVIILASGRGDPDPSGRRGYAVYLSATSFVALFTLLFATYALVASVARLAVDDEDTTRCREMSMDMGTVPGMEGMEGMDMGGVVVPSPDCEEVDRGDMVARDSVRAGLVAVGAGVILALHLSRRRDLVAEADFDGSAAWRVDRAFLQAVCFTAVLILLFAGASAAYEGFRVVAPGVTGDFGDHTLERQHGTAGLFSLGYLALAAGSIFLRGWREVRPEGPETSPAGSEPSAPDDAPSE